MSFRAVELRLWEQQMEAHKATLMSSRAIIAALRLNSRCTKALGGPTSELSLRLEQNAQAIPALWRSLQAKESTSFRAKKKEHTLLHALEKQQFANDHLA